MYIVYVGMQESTIIYSIDSTSSSSVVPPNFTYNDINVCVLPSERKIDEPIGGVSDEEIVDYKIDKYQGSSVALNATTTPTDLPNWFIIPPILCPHYTQYYHSGHRAVDLVNRKCGSSRWIVAVNRGKVTFTGWRGGYGNRIEILHENGMVSTYSHLSTINVKVGQEVSLGFKIGIMGTTGKSTGIHLHFEIIYQGVKIDPDIYLAK